MDAGGPLTEQEAPVVDTRNYLWQEEPPRFREENVDPLLAWCAREGTSDINLQTDRPVYCEINGKLNGVTRRNMDAADMDTFLRKLYGPEALAKLAGGRDLDLAYEVRSETNERFRFRVNITPIMAKGRDAVQITLRVLPNEPPTFAERNIEQGIIDNFSPRQGLILVTGPTGSGKTTLLASGMRMMIERPGGCGKLLTYEAPIEFVYDSIIGPNSLVSQSEIDKHLPTFAAGVRNALRRKPNIILVGESRDRETVLATIEAGQTGHAVYSTVHTTGVAATVRRMMSVFDPAERTERAFALMEVLRMIVTQVLIPKKGGGRIACREFLPFDDEIREHLLSMSQDRWTVEVQRMVRERGQPMSVAAQKLYDEDLIDRRQYLLLCQTVEVGLGEL